jgi:DNA-binding response OmpR family regulator
LKKSISSDLLWNVRQKCYNYNMNEQTGKNKRKILFVDDDKFMLDMYALKFGKANYEIKTAESTTLGLNILRDGFAPDVLLVDILMAGMNGLEFITVVRKENLAPNAVYIMLTNQGSSEDIAKSHELNVDGYIVKATTIPSEVLAEVEKIYNSRKK